MKFDHCVTCGQFYKASTIVIYESRVVNMNNLLVTTILDMQFTSVNCL